MDAKTLARDMRRAAAGSIRCAAEHHLLFLRKKYGHAAVCIALALYRDALRITKNGKQNFYVSQDKLLFTYCCSKSTLKKAFEACKEARVFLLARRGGKGEARRANGQPYADEYLVVTHKKLSESRPEDCHAFCLPAERLVPLRQRKVRSENENPVSLTDTEPSIASSTKHGIDTRYAKLGLVSTERKGRLNADSGENAPPFIKIAPDGAAALAAARPENQTPRQGEPRPKPLSFAPFKEMQAAVLEETGHRVWFQADTHTRFRGLAVKYGAEEMIGAVREASCLSQLGPFFDWERGFGSFFADIAEQIILARRERAAKSEEEFFNRPFCGQEIATNAN